MTSTSEDYLLQKLNDRSSAYPVLFLGAGFSYGAVSEKKARIRYRGKPLGKHLTEHELGLGSDLANDLYQEFYVSNPPKRDGDYLNAIQRYNEAGDLISICSAINGEGKDRKKALKDFLTSYFSDCKPNPSNDFHKLFTSFPWNKIYTLNIDDLVENLFYQAGKALFVHYDNEQHNNKNGDPELYKLHGDVNHPEVGYTFSIEEYTEDTINPTYMVEQFCDDFFRQDIIFLGTELNEKEIDFMLKRRIGEGNRQYTDVFFISPKLGPILQNRISEHSNYYFIPWSTKTFLEKVAEIGKSTDKNDILVRDLRQRDVHFVNDELASHNKYYESKLYFGEPPIYDDIIDGWDFKYPEYASKRNDILSSTENQFIAIIGKSYVGKSTVALRILLDFMQTGYIGLEFKAQDDSVIKHLKDYLKIFQNGNKFAILVENAAFKYEKLISLINDPELSSYKIALIMTSNEKLHTSKRHAFDGDSRYREIAVRPDITYGYAKNIYDKLDEKSRLGFAKRYADNMSDTLQFFRNSGDVINLLYRLTHSKTFIEYFKSVIEGSEASQDYRNALIEIAVYRIFGIDGYPKRRLLKLNRRVNEKRLFDYYGDILSLDNTKSTIKIRCGDIIEQVLINNLSEKEKVEIIRKNVLELAGRFDEYNNNDFAEEFQIIIKEKTLRNSLKLSNDTIRQLYFELEVYFKGISYFWIQRALLELHAKNFNQAEIFIGNAKQIRPHSYQADHALAKNYMERAVYELDSYGSVSYAREMFEKGETLVVSLINDKDFRKSFCYSVHMYTDMKMKYYSRREKISDLTDGERLKSEDIKKFTGWILKGFSICNDKYMLDIKSRFIEFSIRRGFTVEVDDLVHLDPSITAYNGGTVEDDGYMD